MKGRGIEMMKNFTSAVLVCGLLVLGCKKEEGVANNVTPAAAKTITTPGGVEMVQVRLQSMRLRLG